MGQPFVGLVDGPWTSVAEAQAMTRALVALLAGLAIAVALLVERWTRPPDVDDIDWLAEYPQVFYSGTFPPVYTHGGNTA